MKKILATQIRCQVIWKRLDLWCQVQPLTENWTSSPVHFKHLPHYLTFQLGCSRNISHLLWPINQCELTLNGFGCYNMALRGRTRQFSAYRANVRESKGAFSRNIYASVVCAYMLQIYKSTSNTEVTQVDFKLIQLMCFAHKNKRFESCWNMLRVRYGMYLFVSFITEICAVL